MVLARLAGHADVLDHVATPAHVLERIFQPFQAGLVEQRQLGRSHGPGQPCVGRPVGVDGRRHDGLAGLVAGQHVDHALAGDVVAAALDLGRGPVEQGQPLVPLLDHGRRRACAPDLVDLIVIAGVNVHGDQLVGPDRRAQHDADVALLPATPCPQLELGRRAVAEPRPVAHGVPRAQLPLARRLIPGPKWNRVEPQRQQVGGGAGEGGLLRGVGQRMLQNSRPRPARAAFCNALTPQAPLAMSVVP